MFCMIKPDRPPYCSWNTIGVFWVRPLDFFLGPGMKFDELLAIYAALLARRRRHLDLGARPS
jgi:hypothetical protein